MFHQFASSACHGLGEIAIGSRNAGNGHDGVDEMPDTLRIGYALRVQEIAGENDI